MTNYYVKLTQQEAVQANDILFFELVSEDTCVTNIKLPFLPDKSFYIDITLWEKAYKIDWGWEKVAQTNLFIANLLLNKISEEQAISEGLL